MTNRSPIRIDRIMKVLEEYGAFDSVNGQMGMQLAYRKVKFHIAPKLSAYSSNQAIIDAWETTRK